MEPCKVWGLLLEERWTKETEEEQPVKGGNRLRCLGRLKSLLKDQAVTSWEEGCWWDEQDEE